ncbi:MAG TPA: dienelactone hydrolase family protein [Trebonia sp.]
MLETAAPLFVCEPSGASRGGVIVVHDMLGLTHDAEAACRHLARDGWLTVAPFLYHSRGGPTFGLSSLAAARAELGRRSPGELGADLTAAASYLARRGCGDLAVVGFGTGGCLAASAASSVPCVIAAVTIGAVEGDSCWPDARPLAELVSKSPVPLLDLPALSDPVTSDDAWQRVTAFLASA